MTGGYLDPALQGPMSPRGRPVSGGPPVSPTRLGDMQQMQQMQHHEYQDMLQRAEVMQMEHHNQGYGNYTDPNLVFHSVRSPKFTLLCRALTLFTIT